MSFGYRYVVDQAVFETLSALEEFERQWLADRSRLVAHPHQEGDYAEFDAKGRRLEVTLFGEWLVTFWVDHPVKDVRIVGCERVE
jgi:hypothetical protein